MCTTLWAELRAADEEEADAAERQRVTQQQTAADSTVGVQVPSTSSDLPDDSMEDDEDSLISSESNEDDDVEFGDEGETQQGQRHMHGHHDVLEPQSGQQSAQLVQQLQMQGQPQPQAQQQPQQRPQLDQPQEPELNPMLQLSVQQVSDFATILLQSFISKERAAHEVGMSLKGSRSA